MTIPLYELSEEEYQRIECEMTSLCLRGMALEEASSEHEQIQKEMDAWHKKYDHLFEGKN